MPAVKRGKNATEEGKAARLAKLRASAPSTASYDTLALANPNRPLTTKQREFVKHWATGETIRSAAIRAGYADDGAIAYRLAKDPAILKIYDAEKKKYEEAAQMSRKKVMDMLLEAYDHAKMVSEPSSMVAAAREVGKMCGYYEPARLQVEVNHTGRVLIEKLNKLSDDDLLKLIENDDKTVDAEDVQYREVGNGE